MSTKIKEGLLLYHITAVENIEDILASGLMPRKQLGNFKNIADREILKDREKYNLEDFTPFHFFSKNPFAGKVQKDNPDTEFVFITIDRSLAIHNNFLIIPCHPLHFREHPLKWEDGFKAIDWDLMETRDYHNHECKLICMAESLFRGTVLSKHFKIIFVKTDIVKSYIENLLSKYSITDVWVTTCTGMFVT